MLRSEALVRLIRTEIVQLCGGMAGCQLKRILCVAPMVFKLNRAESIARSRLHVAWYNIATAVIGGFRAGSCWVALA